MKKKVSDIEKSKDENDEVKFFEYENTNKKFVRRESKVIDEILNQNNTENIQSPAQVYEKHHPKQSDIVEQTDETEKSEKKQTMKKVNPNVNKDIKEAISEESKSQIQNNPIKKEKISVLHLLIVNQEDFLQRNHLIQSLAHLIRRLIILIHRVHLVQEALVQVHNLRLIQL